MERFDLKATLRASTGKGHARALRRQGRIPAVLYGPKISSMPLSVSALDLANLYRESESEHVLINLIIEKGNGQKNTVMIKELQTAPVTDEYLHVDFHEVSLEEEVVVNVPVELTGKPRGVERGGILQLVRYELAISCLPTDIPGKIEVDVSHLDIGDSFHVEDIDTGEKIRLLYDTNFTVATVVAPSVEEEEEVPEEELEEAEEAEVAEAESAEGTSDK